MVSARVDLPVDGNLLDSDFVGYKLSLDAVPIDRLPFDGLTVPQPSSSWSMHYALLYGRHNSLFEGFSRGGCYVIDAEWNLCFVCREGQSKSTISKMCQLPHSDSTDRLCPSLVALSDSLVVFCDGGTTLSLIQVDTTEGKATVKSTCEMVLKGYIQDAHVVGDQLHLAVESIQDVQASGEGDVLHHEAVLNLLRCSFEPKLQIEQTEMLQLGKATLQYCGFQSTGSDSNNSLLLYVAVENGTVTFAVDPSQEGSSAENGSSAPVLDCKYLWKQDERFAYAVVTPSEPIHSFNLDLVIDGRGLTLGVGETLLRGELGGDVDDEHTRVRFVAERIELRLRKQDPADWTEFLVGSDKGQLDPELVLQAVDALPDGRDAPIAPMETREDCDATAADSWLLCIDPWKRETVRQIDVSGHQWLFSRRQALGDPPLACLRSDVDGIIYRMSNSPKSEAYLCRHEDTFNALGFIAAGKSSRRYVSCSPEMSYACIADDVRHVFLYWKPQVAADMELRHRKNPRMSAVAKQQVITIDGGLVMGLCAGNDCLWILTDKEIVCAVLRQKEIC